MLSVWFLRTLSFSNTDYSLMMLNLPALKSHRNPIYNYLLIHNYRKVRF